MGMASVIVLNNDLLHELRDDPEAGAKIRSAILHLGHARKGERDGDFRYGQAVSCAHSSGHQIVVTTYYGGSPLHKLTEIPAGVVWEMKEALERSGYRVVKRRKPKGEPAQEATT